jgi:hypothetical protein
MEPIKEHWHFALMAGLHLLEEFVYEFHLHAQKSEQKGHAYIGGYEPLELIRLIDGFLEERAFLHGGEVSNLERMRLALEKELAPIYAQGRQKALDAWNSASEQKLAEMVALDFDKFRALGRNFGLALNLSQSGLAWFVEAFAKQWREEWMAYHKRINNW